MHDRADREGEHRRAETDRAAERPTGGEHDDLDACAHQPQRVARAAIPVISPSRGPGPSPAPMYSAEPIPKANTPATISAIFRARSSGSGRWGRTTLTVPPMSTALRIVPRPGRTRSGIHSRSRAKPTMMITLPTPIPVWRLMPLCSTSHGAKPMSAATISATPVPAMTRPPTHCATRRVIDEGIAPRR